MTGRLDFRVKLAGIDIGTNTLRLLIAEFSADGKYRTVESGRNITRLGEGVSFAGRLKDEAMDRALCVLKGYADKCSEIHVGSIYAVATSAVREAANGRDFLSRVKNETGIGVVRFTEQYIESDPPQMKEMELLERAIEDRLQREGCFIGLKISGRIP